MPKEDVKRINEQGLKAWDSHNADAFVAIFANNAVWRDVTLPEPIRTKEGIRQYFQSWMTAFPDLKTTATHAVITDDEVAVELEWDGTHKGPLQGPPGTPAIPATGKKVHGRGAYFAKVKNGKVVEFNAHPDAAGLMMQLGLMGPPPK